MTIRADVERLRAAIVHSLANLSPLNDDEYSRGVRRTAGVVLADVDVILAKPSLGDGVLSIAVGTPLADVERSVIEATLQACGGDKKKTAGTLGISVKTLYARLSLYEGIRKALALGAGRMLS